MAVPRRIAASCSLALGAVVFAVCAHAQPQAGVSESAGAAPAPAVDAGDYLADAVRTDAALRDAVDRALAHFSRHDAGWVTSYGTATPAKRIELAGRPYLLFQGCKPHDCPSETYTLLYDPATHTVAAGAFVRNRGEGTSLSETRIHWLETAPLDLSRALGPHLF